MEQSFSLIIWTSGHGRSQVWSMEGKKSNKINISILLILVLVLIFALTNYLMYKVILSDGFLHY